MFSTITTLCSLFPCRYVLGDVVRWHLNVVLWMTRKKQKKEYIKRAKLQRVTARCAYTCTSTHIPAELCWWRVSLLQIGLTLRFLPHGLAEPCSKPAVYWSILCFSLFLSFYAQIFIMFLVSYFCYYMCKATVKHTNTHYDSQKTWFCVNKFENKIVKEMFAILQIPFLFVCIHTYKEKHIILKKKQ